MQNTDIARIRGCLEGATSAWNNLNIILPDKKGYMYKSSKSELAQILKTYRPKVPSEISGAKILSVLIIDFMAYYRKVSEVYNHSG